MFRFCIFSHKNGFGQRTRYPTGELISFYVVHWVHSVKSATINNSRCSIFDSAVKVHSNAKKKHFTAHVWYICYCCCFIGIVTADPQTFNGHKQHISKMGGCNTQGTKWRHAVFNNLSCERKREWEKAEDALWRVHSTCVRSFIRAHNPCETRFHCSFLPLVKYTCKLSSTWLVRDGLWLFFPRTYNNKTIWQFWSFYKPFKCYVVIIVISLRNYFYM